MSNLSLLYEVINLLCLYSWLKKLISDNDRVTFETHMVTYVQPTSAGFVTFRFRTINSKYFQRLDLLRSCFVSGSDILQVKSRARIRYKSLESRSRIFKQGSRGLAKSRIDHSIPLLYTGKIRTRNVALNFTVSLPVINTCLLCCTVFNSTHEKGLRYVYSRSSVYWQDAICFLLYD